MNKLIKGIMWFFKQPDDTQTELTRKLKGYRDPQQVDTNPVASVKLNEAVIELLGEASQPGPFGKVPEGVDPIEYYKEHLVCPYDITDVELEHAMQLAGFQKSVVVNGENVYDPRVVAAIKLSINFYYVGVFNRTKDLIKQLDAQLK
ncbi:hypothetical protein D5W64_12700 [Salmonella enterica subsp. enterica serovar Saintpaul]|nr:hypothetical protein [Salmonella enterica subsp. enterica serovar Saintpaul]